MHRVKQHGIKHGCVQREIGIARYPKILEFFGSSEEKKKRKKKKRLINREMEKREKYPRNSVRKIRNNYFFTETRRQTTFFKN